MSKYALFGLCAVLAGIRIGNGETNWYEFATLSPQERQGIIDAISKTCAEVPLLQQPFWRHQPELYRVSPQEHLLPQRHHEHSRVSNANCEVHGLLRRCQLDASKEPQHRRLQEEEPAGDEEPAPSEDRPPEDGALADAQAEWVEPDLGIANTADILPSVLDEPDTDEISDLEAEAANREAMGKNEGDMAGEGPSDVDDLQEAEELSEEAGVGIMEAAREAEPGEAEPEEAEPQEAKQEEPAVGDAEAREEEQLMEDLDRQQEGPSEHDTDILEKAQILREQQMERMADESSEPTEPQAPELKYWQKEAAQQEAAAGAADREDVGEDRGADLALTPRERHHEHHVDAEKHAVLRRAFLGETTTSSEAYMKATRAHGDPHRLSTFFKKLLDGKAVSVAAIGGTVTAGGGAGGRHKQQGYAGRVATWLESLGSEQEPVNVTFRNMAVEGTTSMYMAQCLHNLVSNGTDLILVEPSVGDWAALDLDRTDEGVRAPLNNSIRRGFERLLRRLMRLPGAPAVLVVHWWSPLEFQGSFWEVAQDELDVIASYYDIQTISFRDGYYNEIMSARTGFAPETFLCDSINPNPLGHRYLADLVISYLQDVLAAAVLGVGHTSHATGGHAVALPPPMFPGNDGAPDALCINPGHDFKLLVTSHEDWLWVNEAQVEMNHPPRWGFIAATPGKVLTLQFPMPKPPQALPDGAEQGRLPMTVGLGMLRSYQHMGVAEVTCTQGCSCESQAFDLHQEEKRSLVFFHYMEVGWAPQCSMSITIAEETSSGEHKVKVTSLAVSDDYRDESHVYSLHESAVATDQYGITGRRLLLHV